MLLVRNLTRNVTDAHLKEIFGTCGAVKTAEVAIDPTVGLSKGHARVELSTRALAVAAVEQFDGAQVDGMRMKVALSDAPPERAAAQPPPRNGVHWQGGGYHGGGGKGGGPPPPPPRDARDRDYGRGPPGPPPPPPYRDDRGGYPPRDDYDRRGPPPPPPRYDSRGPRP